MSDKKYTMAELKELWGENLYNLNYSQSEAMSYYIYELAVEKEYHHPLICEYTDLHIGYDTIFKKRKFIKQLSQVLKETVIDFYLYKEILEPKEGLIMIFLFDRIIEIDISKYTKYDYMHGFDGKFYQKVLNYIKRLPKKHRINIIEKWKDALLRHRANSNSDMYDAFERYKELFEDKYFLAFLDIWGFQMYNETASTTHSTLWDHLEYNIDNIIKFFDSTIQRLYRYYYTNSNKLDEMKKKEKRIIEISRRYAYAQQKDYFKYFYINDSFEGLSSSNALYRHQFIQGVNSLYAYDKTYIRTGFKPEHFDEEIVDMLSQKIMGGSAWSMVFIAKSGNIFQSTFYGVYDKMNFKDLYYIYFGYEDSTAFATYGALRGSYYEFPKMFRENECEFEVFFDEIKAHYESVLDLEGHRLWK